jgi:hypothetical protein
MFGDEPSSPQNGSGFFLPSGSIWFFHVVENPPCSSSVHPCRTQNLPWLPLF